MCLITVLLLVVMFACFYLCLLFKIAFAVWCPGFGVLVGCDCVVSCGLL